MKKYIVVQDLVTRLTDDPTLRTFFTLYLMAETEAEKSAITNRFRLEGNQLDTEKRASLFAAFAESFKKLPSLAGNLLDRVIAEKHTVLAA